MERLLEARFNKSDLAGNGWNLAYKDVKDDTTSRPDEGTELYRIILTSRNRNELGQRSDNVKFLKVLDGSDVKKAVDADYIESKLSTSDITTTDSEHDATLFQLTDETKDPIIKVLSSLKARRRLAYDKVDAQKVEGAARRLQAQAGENSIDLNREELIKAYLYSLFKRLTTAAEQRGSIVGDYPFSGLNTDDSVTRFYNLVLNTPDKVSHVIDSQSEPLWHNPILTLAAYLYKVSGYAKDDLLTKTTSILNCDGMKDRTSEVYSCDSDMVKMASNPSLLVFEGQQIRVVLTMFSFLVGGRGYSGGFKNSRIRGNEDLKKVAIGRFFFDNSHYDEGQVKLYDAYISGQSDDRPKLRNVMSLEDYDLASSTVRPYNNLVSDIKQYWTLEPDSKYLSVYFQWQDRAGKDWKAIKLTTNDNEEYFIPQMKEGELKKFISLASDQKAQVRFCFSKEALPRRGELYEISSIRPSMRPDGQRIGTLSDNIFTVSPGGLAGYRDSTFDLTYVVNTGEVNLFGNDLGKEDDAKVKAEPTGEVPGAVVNGAMVQKFISSGLLKEIPPDGTETYTNESGIRMLRNCTVKRGDIIAGGDGKYHVVLKKDFGSGKRDVVANSKILRWSKDAVDGIRELGFSLNPGDWGKTGVTYESLMASLGNIHNDIYD